jgi:hypothetical protein
VHLSVWWHPTKLLQVIVLPLGSSVIVKGDKSYYLKSVSAEGETWARDIGLLHDYLENHFPEVRIAFSHFRDVPPELAEEEVRRRMMIDAPTQPIPTVEDIARAQRQLQTAERDAHQTESLFSLMGGEADLLTGYMHRETRTQRAQSGVLRQQLDRDLQRLDLLQHLQREYQRKGSAAVYTFTISSNIQFAEDAPRFRDVLRIVVKDLDDMHRYQVSQKLCGGRLNIQVAEAQQPAIAWIEQWFGGALNPNQTRRPNALPEALHQSTQDHVMVTPDEPIVVDGHTRHGEKHMAARFFSDVLQRLDTTEGAREHAALSPGRAAPDTLPLTLGFRVNDTGSMTDPLAFPLTQMVHLYISGTTGSGKSFLARVLIEEAAQYENLSVVVLDPRNQSIGLLVPEDRPKILSQYEQFGMKPASAHGYAFGYFAPGLPYIPALPANLAALAAGKSIVSFKGLDDGRRCDLAARILDAVFETCSERESENPRLLVVADEAQLFTRKRVDESAKSAVARVERSLDRIAREGRKFGIVLALVSQTMKDFAYELASIRQMTTTKIFLRNSDREIEYAADILGDGRQLVQLATGMALVHNANWGVVRLRVRPPYSKVFELGDAEIRSLVGTERDPSKTMTADAQRLFTIIKAHPSSPDHPLNMSRVADLGGITSKRRLLELIGELEHAGLIRTRKLQERGCPRVIDVIHNPI